MRQRKQGQLPLQSKPLSQIASRVTAGLLASALIVGVAYQGAKAGHEEVETPFDEAEIFFELNNTDGDLGIHALIDGDAWKRLEIEDPRERKMLDIRVRGRLRKQGLTEIFFESDEPTFEELLPEEFFDRFPEGIYEVEGRTLDGEELESETEVTHLMPAPAEASVNGVAAAEDCDVDPLPTASAPVTISWEPVTLSHPDLGRRNEPINVVNYEVVVEIDETPFRTSTILPADQTALSVPQEFLDLVEPGDEIKFELLAREESFNQTAIESCFELE